MSPRRAHGTKSNQLQRYIPAFTPRAAVSDNFRIIVKEMQIKEEDTICGPSVPSQLMGLRVALFFLESNLAVTHKKKRS